MAERKRKELENGSVKKTTAEDDLKRAASGTHL
jgi:hypothetical protein